MTAARLCVAGFSTCPRARRASSAWEASPASPPKSFHKPIKRVLAPLSQDLRGWVGVASRTGAAGARCTQEQPAVAATAGLLSPSLLRYRNDEDRPVRRSLQKALRIDVDLELEVPFGLWACGEPEP